MIYLKLFFVVILRTCTDICFKASVHHLDFDSVSGLKDNIIMWGKNIYLWLGLLFGLGNLIAWIYVLQDFDLSYAYPFLSICYITIIISGKFIFDEHLDKQKIIGMVMMSIGAGILFFG